MIDNLIIVASVSFLVYLFIMLSFNWSGVIKILNGKEGTFLSIVALSSFIVWQFESLKSALSNPPSWFFFVALILYFLTVITNSFKERISIFEDKAKSLKESQIEVEKEFKSTQVTQKSLQTQVGKVKSMARTLQISQNAVEDKIGELPTKADIADFITKADIVDFVTKDDLAIVSSEVKTISSEVADIKLLLQQLLDK